MLAIAFFIFSFAQNSWQGEVFYNAIATDNLQSIDKAISFYENGHQTMINSVYLGALYIKKSSFQKTPKDKIIVFNKGKELIENAIKLSSENIEMRFIRLMMQEKSPRILKYNTDLVDDKNLIIKNYSSLDNTLQIIISDYAKSSNILELK